MSIFNFIFSSLQPPKVVPFSEYNDTQYVFWKLVFRPKDYPFDLYLLACFLTYFASYFVFQAANKRRASHWFSLHTRLFKSQFSKSPAKLTSDGPATYFAFATGRKHINFLQTTFDLLPRQDLLVTIASTLWSLVTLDYEPQDILTLSFSLPVTPNGNWVWAIIKKDIMEKQRKARWDLTFTKASDNPVLPKDTILMSEAADVAECIFKALSSTSSPARNLFSAITNTPHFKSLIITDQPIERPHEPIPSNKKERRLILTLGVPSEAQDDSVLLLAVFDLIDIISANQGLQLRPETKNRLKSRRDALEAELRKDAEREQKEIEEEARRSEKKREKDEAISGMSGTEQRKALEKEQKRAIRKAQGKMVKKA